MELPLTVPSDEKPRVRLENWSHFQFPFSRLTGNAYGHPFHADGEEVWSSRILLVQDDADSTIVTLAPGVEVETRNSIYILGAPHA